MTPDQREKLSPHYAMLTAAAEDYIRRLIAREHAADNETAVTGRRMALGVWLFWNDLTTGRQQDGDGDRLEGLIFPERDRPEAAP